MAKYWNESAQDRIPNPRIDAFLSDLFDLYRKHNMSIGHEEREGVFIIEPLAQSNLDWISAAEDGISKCED